MKNKKNKMTISCTVNVEVNFKAICDFLNPKEDKKGINGNHSKKISAFMEKYFKDNYKNLSATDKADVNKAITAYIQDKNKNGIY
jgi:hypothetical protein